MNFNDLLYILQKESVEKFEKYPENMISGFAVEAADSNGKIFFSLSKLDFRDNFFRGDPHESINLITAAFFVGAVLCVVRKESYYLNERALYRFRNRIIIVDDVIKVLQKLASYLYRENPIPVIGITGSAGKTTTKDMISTVLNKFEKRALVSKGNQNNGIGLPMSISQLGNRSDYEIAVLEMGMSCPGGEIKRLCSIAPPSISVLLNILPIHLENFGTIHQIAEGKAEIFTYMAPSGFGVLNADDPLISEDMVSTDNYVSFGHSINADFQARDVTLDLYSSRFKLRTPSNEFEVNLNVPGRQNIMNALATIAVCDRLKLPQPEVISYLASYVGTPQRGVIHNLPNRMTLIDDTYNSNPYSLIFAVETADRIAVKKGRLILIAGEMLEMGADEDSLHYETGCAVALPSIYLLVGMGRMMDYFLNGFSSKSDAKTILCDNVDDIVKHVIGEAVAGDVILVKGSRRSRLERVVQAIHLHFQRFTERAL